MNFEEKLQHFVFCCGTILFTIYAYEGGLESPSADDFIYEVSGRGSVRISEIKWK